MGRVVKGGSGRGKMLASIVVVVTKPAARGLVDLGGAAKARAIKAPKQLEKTKIVNKELMLLKK